MQLLFFIITDYATVEIISQSDTAIQPPARQSSESHTSYRKVKGNIPTLHFFKLNFRNTSTDFEKHDCATLNT